MTLGWALLIIAAVWLIDKHHLWKRVAKIAGVLLVLAGLGISGHILYDRHEAANERKRYEAEAAQMEEEPKVDPIPPGAGDPIPAGAQIEIPCTKWMAQDKNGKCWAERSLDMLNQKEVSTERQHVDCFDPTTGRLDGFPVLPDGYHLTSCSPAAIQKPAGQCTRLVSDWFAAHAPGAPDCYLPVRPDYRKEAKPDPLGIRPGSTQSCTGTNPNDPCNIR